ncbi:Periplasmic serine endoprotease DegP precursor [Legionella massiliensis]|uniref:Periplasmic serine endoprotease DegP n=1 Tax=Legionella massiliensis TaxID=1034943 RepID=A0A078KRS1_9GAMM|nr:trypsin-like peptidase domain-containing protein [Legionella massiliensis]CDZ77125.1 Periplasmic serine endoprotease DegP precursor [Legionella massiliensis]CEE12863.1 putative periplasmic serine endoprotease DegP-like precursor [Legionella massiliensis]
MSQEKMELDLSRSLVKITASVTRPSVLEPWKTQISSHTLTGCIIEQNQEKFILTSSTKLAHATHVKGNFSEESNFLRMEIVTIDHSCNLALLKCSAPEFVERAVPLALADKLPNRRAKGEIHYIHDNYISSSPARIRGIESNSQGFMKLSFENKNNMDEGPLIHDSKITGFSLGFGDAIPLPIIQHFILHPGGFPMLPFSMQLIKSPLMKQKYGLVEKNQGALLILDTNPLLHDDALRPGDVVMAIDGYSLLTDGTVKHPDYERPVSYNHLIQMHGLGDMLGLQIKREHQDIMVTTQLNTKINQNHIVKTNLENYDYFAAHGVIFVPLTKEYIEAACLNFPHHTRQSPQFLLLQEKLKAQKSDDISKYFTVCKVIPCEDTLGLEMYTNYVIKTINDQPIKNFNDLISILNQRPEDGLHAIVFEDNKQMVLKHLDVAQNLKLLNSSGYVTNAPASLLQKNGRPKRKVDSDENQRPKKRPGILEVNKDDVSKAISSMQGELLQKGFDLFSTTKALNSNRFEISPAPEPIKADLNWSVVKLKITVKGIDFQTPWSASTQTGVGTGFVIEHEGKKVIITNAHCATNITHLSVQFPKDPTQYEVKLLAINHYYDLAILDCQNPEFLNKAIPMALADSLPENQNNKMEIMVHGFPAGRDFTETSGHITRIETNINAHSREPMLSLKLDVTQQPGNSGGPVTHKGKVVGVANQGPTVMQGTSGFAGAIPLPILKHFLAHPKVLPSLKFGAMPMINPCLREKYSSVNSKLGILVIKTEEGTSAAESLRVNDVILSIDGYPVMTDGKMLHPVSKEPIMYTHAIQMHAFGETVELAVLRDKEILTVKIPLLDKPRMLVKELYEDDKNKRSDYFAAHGLVFVRLSKDYIRKMEAGLAGSELYTLSKELENSKTEKVKHKVVISTILDCEYTEGYENGFKNSIVETVDGVQLKDLYHLMHLLMQVPENGLHTLVLSNKQEIVLKHLTPEENKALLLSFRIDAPQAPEPLLNRYANFWKKPAPASTDQQLRSDQEIEPKKNLWV